MLRKLVQSYLGALLMTLGWLYQKLVALRKDPFNAHHKSCMGQWCPEHLYCEVGGDHVYEMHHTQEEHVGDDTCKCDVYLDDEESIFRVGRRASGWA